MLERTGAGLLTLGFVAPLLLTAPAAAHEPEFEALRPGKFVVHKQTVPVRVVFIGFDEDQVDTSELASLLPKTYKPVVRIPRFYGLSGRDTGLEFRFRYRFVHKSRAFRRRFFSYLQSAGVPGPLTPFQAAYNDQANNFLDVSGPVLFIDAPSVEKWLEEHAGTEDDCDYTIYFINWFGHPGFKFHVYTKTDEADPDTGFNFGLERDSRKMIAWGGTRSRSWFYDFSAGPEFWASNFNVDDADVDGDGLADYRIPPIWEYAQGGYRLPEFLSLDMGLLARFVAIDLLFTTSPLYDPLVSAPDVGGAKVAHIAMLEDDPTSSGLDFIKKDFIRKKLRRLESYYRWRVGLTDTNPIDAGAKRALDIWGGNLIEDDCWNAFGRPFAQLFCYFTSHLDTYIPEYPGRDYVAEVFGYNTTDAAMGAGLGILGYADDNWTDGTQTHVFVFDTPEARELGIGFTTTTLHEVGHHVGLSHPHDGYDSELGVDFIPVGFLQFAWSGDESDTVMHFLTVSNGFGRFDRDNMHRWEMAGYLNWANALLGDILKHPRARRVRELIERADERAAEAKEAFRDWEYLDAARNARRAYALLAAAAKTLGIETPTLDAALRPLPSPARRDACRMRSPGN